MHTSAYEHGMETVHYVTYSLCETKEEYTYGPFGIHPHLPLGYSIVLLCRCNPPISSGLTHCQHIGSDGVSMSAAERQFGLTYM